MSQFLWVRNLGGVWLVTPWDLSWGCVTISARATGMWRLVLKVLFQDDSPVDGELVQAIGWSPRFLTTWLSPRHDSWFPLEWAIQERDQGGNCSYCHFSNLSPVIQASHSSVWEDSTPGITSKRWDSVGNILEFGCHNLQTFILVKSIKLG